MAPRVEFHFDFGSPNAYLAHHFVAEWALEKKNIMKAFVVDRYRKRSPAVRRHAGTGTAGR